jgi:hypothetical protein
MMRLMVHLAIMSRTNCDTPSGVVFATPVAILTIRAMAKIIVISIAYGECQGLAWSLLLILGKSFERGEPA